MLRAVTYNCDPESLGEIAAEAFVDAFENEVRVKPSYRNLALTVTFEAGRSRVVSVTEDSDECPDPTAYDDEFADLAERAFRAAYEAAI